MNKGTLRDVNPVGTGFCFDSTDEVVAVYQSWNGGKSALHLASVDGQLDVDNFLRSAKNSDTFAETYCFAREEDAKDHYYYERPHEEEE